MIVSEVRIERAGVHSDKEYYKIMINMFDRWWEWQPVGGKPRLGLQDAVKEYDALRSIIHAS